MTTTYRRTQPVHQPLMKDTFYSDYDVEKGISKRVNCLVALTVVALIVGGAALGISVMILLQGMDASARREAEVTTLQLRVKQLEHQTGIRNSTEEAVWAAGPPSAEEAFPAIDEEPPQEAGGPTEGEEAPPDADEPIHEEALPESEGLPMAGGSDNAFPDDDEVGGRRSSRPDDLEDDDDDDGGYGSGDCPVLPRPVCPVDMTVCYTKDPCPVPVCCRRQ